MTGAVFEETTFKSQDVAELSAAFEMRRICWALTCFQKLSKPYMYSKYNRPSPLGVKMSTAVSQCDTDFVQQFT